jgi:hypothetical protein
MGHVYGSEELGKAVIDFYKESEAKYPQYASLVIDECVSMSCYFHEDMYRDFERMVVPHIPDYSLHNPVRMTVVCKEDMFYSLFIICEDETGTPYNKCFIADYYYNTGRE